MTPAHEGGRRSPPTDQREEHRRQHDGEQPDVAPRVYPVGDAGWATAQDHDDRDRPGKEQGCRAEVDNPDGQHRAMGVRGMAGEEEHGRGGDADREGERGCQRRGLPIASPARRNTVMTRPPTPRWECQLESGPPCRPDSRPPQSREDVAAALAERGAPAMLTR